MAIIDGGDEYDLGSFANVKEQVFLLSAVLLASALLPLPGRSGKILGVPSICPFYEITGLPCPACGMTRSFVCFAHGRFAEAFHWNLLGPPLWVLLFLLLLRAAFALITRRPVLPMKSGLVNVFSWSLLAVLFVFDVARIALLVSEHRRF